MLQEVGTDCALGLYRLAGRVSLPAIRAHLRQRAARGREDPARLAERFGRSDRARPSGPLVWLHGASVGEALSSLPLIERLVADRPKLNLLMTTGTVTSAALMAERLPAGVIHQYAPLDLATAVEAFLERWRPDMGLIIESELWPNLLTAAHRQGVELTLLNGRMSSKSYRSWRYLRPMSRRLLGLFSQVLAQSPQDQNRFRALGARNPVYLGNLKSAAPALTADPAELATLRAALGARPCWLAASTHPGEEQIVARVHARLAGEHPGLVTLIAPRHPDRGPEIEAALAAEGLKTALRSRGQTIGPETAIYLADTIGELGLWYRLAEVVFVGRSLVSKGGQNPLEPARLESAILIGPNSANFTHIVEGMRDAGAIAEVTDGEALAEAVGCLLRDGDARAAMSRAAKAYAEAEAEVLDAVLGALAPSLDRVTGSS